MKKIIIAICTGILLTVSCTDLNEKVYDQIQADDFGKSEAEINAIMGPVYNTLKTTFAFHTVHFLESAGDMSITPTRKGGDFWGGGQYREIHMHTWTAESNLVKGCYNNATKAISTCNMVYETINSSSSLSEESKELALSEIRGIRAYWFYYMVDNWGNIPLVTDYKKTEAPALTSRKDAYDFLIKELSEIKDKVREVNKSNYGKFTKGAAYMILAKLYLNAEAWGVDSSRWDEVVDLCTQIMNMGYKLENNWKTNFQVQNEVSEEAIMAACYSSEDTEDRNQVHLRTLHYLDNIALGASFSAYNGVCAQPDYVKLFDTNDPRYHGSFLIGEMKNPSTGEVLITAHGRPLIHTIDVTIIPGTEREGTTWGDVNQEDGARCYKWEYDKSTLNAMENDFHIFRLADVYLMKAEALVRSGKDNAEATRLVNAIRERAYGNTDHNYTSVTLKEIELERKFELAWEGYSRQDNIRFGTFQNARWLKTSTKGKDYLNLFPIPLEAWQTNNKLVQNPGYPAF